MNHALYRKNNDRSKSSRTYHKRDRTNTRSILKRELKKQISDYKELPRKPRMLASGMNWQNNLKNTCTLGHSGIKACGDGSLESSLKQEKECLVN